MNIRQQQTVIAFRKSCNDLAQAVNEQIFDGDRSFYWVGGVVGGTCDFDDVDFLSPEEMVLILEEGVSYNQYEEWHCANLDHDDYINLYSWLRGCRHDMLNKSKEDNNNNSNQQDNESKD